MRGLACLAAATLTTFPAPPPAFAASDDGSRSRELQQLLLAHNEQVRAPAWAAAVVRNGEIIAVAGIGVRDQASAAPLDVETHQFHWGSITKSVTATMVAGLVADGTLAWDTRLPRVFPDLPMRAEYRDVTVAQLLSHRAGLPPYTRLGPPEAQRFRGYAGTDVQRRDAFMREVLQEAPAAGGDGALVYSNAGPAIAAHAGEIAAGSTWEELVRKHVFQRIGMPTAGFGLPAGLSPEQTRGHAGPAPESLTVMGPGPLPAHPLLDPSGNVRSTVRDLAAYARAHLLALTGRPGPLDGLDVRALHTAPDGRTIGPQADRYAMGWSLRREGSQLVHWHNGSAGQFFAQVELYPDDDLAIVVMSNAGFAGRSAPELIRRIRGLAR